MRLTKIFTQMDSSTKFVKYFVIVKKGVLKVKGFLKVCKNFVKIKVFNINRLDVKPYSHSIVLGGFEVMS